jgi:acyl carrier protein phosphodiesterase
MYPFMEAQNWLYNYRLKEGMRKSFGGLVRRAKYLHESDVAFQVFNDHYKELEGYYADFFPELKAYTFNSLSNLMAE